MLDFLGGHRSPDPSARPPARQHHAAWGIIAAVFVVLGPFLLVGGLMAERGKDRDVLAPMGAMFLGLGVLSALLWIALEVRHRRFYPGVERGAVPVRPGADFQVVAAATPGVPLAVWLEVDVTTLVPAGTYTRLQLDLQLGTGGAWSAPFAVKYQWRHSRRGHGAKPTVSTALWGNDDAVPWAERLVDVRSDGPSSRYRALIRLWTLQPTWAQPGPIAVRGRLHPAPLRPDGHLRLFVADATLD